MLSNEIEQAIRLVKTDAYQMSIGEIINMYNDGDLLINPDFQRLFRWNVGQKSKLIESLLLGIPLPSIFVFERDDAKWELIDGLQRVSTLLEFMGKLKKPGTQEIAPPISLSATQYLPSLYRTVWEKSELVADCEEANQRPLTSTQQLSIKRSRIGVEILKRPSANKTKYDLFQRLNSGGTAANAQELRNCIIIMISSHYSDFLRQLSDSVNFRNVLSASDEQIEKQRHMEYVSRFMVYAFIDYDGKLDIEEYIDESIIQLASNAETQRSGHIFNETFRLLNAALGDGALRRIQGNAPTGRVGLAAFECIATGVARNIDSILAKQSPEDYVRTRIIEFWQSPESDQFFVPGLRGTIRIQRTIPFGATWFST